MSVEQVKPFGIDFLEEVKPVETFGQGTRTVVATNRDITKVGNVIEMGDEDERVIRDA